MTGGHPYGDHDLFPEEQELVAEFARYRGAAR